MFFISDNIDTYTGLRLVGIDGIIVHNDKEFYKGINIALKNKNNLILIFTEKIANEFNEKILEIKSTQNKILTVVVPDRHGSDISNNFISRYIRESIGIKIDANDKKTQ
jgi:V/A-type H+-transporting ATPase subunit F